MTRGTGVNGRQAIRINCIGKENHLSECTNGGVVGTNEVINVSCQQECERNRMQLFVCLFTCCVVCVLQATCAKV